MITPLVITVVSIVAIPAFTLGMYNTGVGNIIRHRKR